MFGLSSYFRRDCFSCSGSFLFLLWLANNQSTDTLKYFAIAYILDCVDGYMARKYKMESKIGDLLDHGGDLFKFIVLFYVLYKNFNITQHKGIIIIMLLLLGLQQLHIGCQEQHSKYETHLTLKIQKAVCINKNLIKYTRFFGTGTIILYTIIISNYLASLKS